VTGLSFGIRKL